MQKHCISNKPLFDPSPNWYVRYTASPFFDRRAPARCVLHFWSTYYILHNSNFKTSHARSQMNLISHDRFQGSEGYRRVLSSAEAHLGCYLLFLLQRRVAPARADALPSSEAQKSVRTCASGSSSATERCCASTSDQSHLRKEEAWFIRNNWWIESTQYINYQIVN